MSDNGNATNWGVVFFVLALAFTVCFFIYSSNYKVELMIKNNYEEVRDERGYLLFKKVGPCNCTKE